MSKDVDRAPLSRPLHVDEIKESASGEVDATKAEMAAIAAILELEALDGLVFAYRFRHEGGGRLHLAGRLKAAVCQTCVVSLEPVETSLDVPVEAEFWPASLMGELERSAEEPGSVGLLDWPEPITDGKVDLGPVIYEALATALDPYPKREGVSFEWSQGKEVGNARTSGPFAALNQLKRR
jgi:uncharacterized metal-binding protein YceD (DUF177 family)